jgi:mannitol-1-phosphate/altronate dehydrogenase
VGAGLRTASIGDALAAQDNLWTVHAGAEIRAVGVLGAYVDGVRHRRRLLDALTDPACAVATLTVTAATYQQPGTDATDPFALLVEALDERRRAGRGPFTVLSCDNLPDSRTTTRTALLRAAEHRSASLARWVDQHVATPRAMVDRITYCAPPEEQDLIRTRIGVGDELAVVAEPFSQWVLTDEFAAERPPWEEVGVQLVGDVSPFVEAKTRILNGSHLALGYLGHEAGHTTVSAALRDPGLAAFVRDMVETEVLPGLRAAPGLDLRHYAATVRARLLDDSLEDPLSRLRRRGSVRIENYLLPSLRAALADGRPAAHLVAVLAAWVRYVADAAKNGTLDALEDPRAERLGPLARRARRDVRPLLGVEDLFGDLAHDHRLGTLLRDALAQPGRSDLHAAAS